MLQSSKDGCVQMNKEIIREGLFTIFLGVVMLVIIIMMVLFILSIISPDNDFCDYDSCSQESFYWEINGSKCFDSTNPECKEFMRLFDVCQEYKKRLGIC